jgi:hypothetical protein
VADGTVRYWSMSLSSSEVSVVEAVSTGVVIGVGGVEGAEEAAGSRATVVDSVMSTSEAASQVTRVESIELGRTTSERSG